MISQKYCNNFYHRVVCKLYFWEKSQEAQLLMPCEEETGHPKWWKCVTESSFMQFFTHSIFQIPRKDQRGEIERICIHLSQKNLQNNEGVISFQKTGWGKTWCKEVMGTANRIETLKTSREGESIRCCCCHFHHRMWLGMPSYKEKCSISVIIEWRRFYKNHFSK